jgi:hypothetical protein
MKISVVIPTYTNFTGLKACIKTMEQFTDMRDIEVVISANGAPPETHDFIFALPDNYKVVWDDNPLGYSKACNAGIRVATGDYIVLLNDDVIFAPQPKNAWVGMLLKPFQKDPAVGLSGPLVSYSPPADSMFIIFFIVMIKREVFDKIGLLDEAFGMGAGEDTAFCIEAMKQGYKMASASEGEVTRSDELNVMVGAFPVYHKGEATVKKLPNWQELFDANSRLLESRYRKPKT